MIEVKKDLSRKSVAAALGQVLVYREEYPEHKPVIAGVDVNSEKTIALLPLLERLGIGLLVCAPKPSAIDEETPLAGFLHFKIPSRL